MGVGKLTKKILTKADYIRKVGELEAQLASTLHFASSALDKAGTKSFVGIAVIVRLHVLGAAELTVPFAVRDCLSQETIDALQKDIARSWEIATMFKPKLEQKDD